MAKGHFKAGNPGKPKGAISEKTKFWNELKDFMVNEGAVRWKEELMKMEGQAFVSSYNNALEFFQPKLSRAQVEANTNLVHTFKVDFEGEDKQGL